MHNHTTWVGESNLTDCSHKYYILLHFLCSGGKNQLNKITSLRFLPFSASQLRLIYMPKKIFLMIQLRKAFCEHSHSDFKRKKTLSYTVTLKALTSSLEFGTEAFHIIQWKHRDNHHSKLEHSSVRTWHWHSSQSLQLFLVLITLFLSSYNTEELDQKGSQEWFSSKILEFSFC